MTINWTEIILALLGTNGITLLTSMLMFKQKKEKMETEIDSSTLDNLEKGFAIQGAQLKEGARGNFELSAISPQCLSEDTGALQ